jgi:glycine cleavage system transcriptional repressor
MQKTFVLTLTGPDRIGFVEKVTGLLLERGGNVETSRMARLGGEFAILMLAWIPMQKKKANI